METIRIFAAAHKALRKTMSEFMVRIGQTNFNHETAVEGLKKAGNEMFFLLTNHAETENNRILNVLEKKLPGASQHDIQDHIKIEKVQHELEVQLNMLDTSASANEVHNFYLKFTSFFSLYLDHIYEEETTTQKLIWENLSVEEQTGIHISIVSKMDPETYFIWLKHMFPAQNETGNVEMLNAIRQNIPEERFELLLGILEQNMGKEEFKSLKQNAISVET